MEKDKLYTDTGICINKFIESGRTEIFYDFTEAEKRAKQQRTYVYPVYDTRGHQHGFGVPK